MNSNNPTATDLHEEQLPKSGSFLYFIGIGGISMSSLAALARHMGYRVEGSDIGANAQIDALRAQGITVHPTHDAANLNGVQTVIYTAAVTDDNPELLYAHEHKIPCMTRAHFLGLLMREYRIRIGVSGTHGKSTTTGMVSEIFLAAQTDESKYAMVGYRLKNTVTEFGSVARGVCEIEAGMLTGVTERTKIFKKGTDAEYTEDGEHFFPLPGDTIVSMNLWGFSAHVLDELWSRMPAFLAEAMRTNPLKCEYFLPFVVNEQLADKTASVRVLPCEESWYGVTYREDLDSVKKAVADMKAEGIYTELLWS